MPSTIHVEPGLTGEDYGMSYVVNDAQFRFPIALQILFAVITLAGIIVLPESPRWVCPFLP